MLYKLNKDKIQYNPTGATVVERNTDYWIVNTNTSYRPDAWKGMIGNLKIGKAAAHGANKNLIRRIPRGSTVYLYHNRVGIIAKGESTSSVRDDGDECSVSMKFKWAYDPEEWPLRVPTAKEINDRLESGHRFRQTLFSIGKEMAEAIDKIEKERRQYKNEDS